jgi:hypothetical protein
MHMRLSRRPAYTLLELLVVVGLIVVLATLTVAVANSSLVDSYRVVGAADRLSGWLLNAKTRALRDRTPIGVRLIRGSDNPTDPEYFILRSAQLIEMPVLYAPVQDSDQNTLHPRSPFICVRYLDQRVTIGGQPQFGLIQESGGTNVTSRGPAGVFLYWPNNVSPYPTFTAGLDLNIGDLLRINELNSLHRIERIDAVAQPNFYAALGKPSLPSGSGANEGRWYKLTLANSLVPLPTTPTVQFFPPSPPYPTNALPVNGAFNNGWTPGAQAIDGLAGTTQRYATGYPPIGGATYFESNYFGLYRGARPVLGEPLLQLPANMGIDVHPGTDVNPPGLSTGDELQLTANLPVTAGQYEIIFNPSGSVMFTEASPIVLWLRDTRNSAGQLPLAVVAASGGVVDIDRNRLMNAGEHVLVSINTKTGAIATFPIYPPDQTGRYPVNDGGRNGPYKYALKAANTGL